MTADEIIEHLDRMLNELRPPRYVEGDTSWAEPAVDWLAEQYAELPSAERYALMGELDMRSLIDEAESYLDEP